MATFSHLYGSDRRVWRDRGFEFYKGGLVFDGINDNVIECVANKLFTKERCEKFSAAHDGARFALVIDRTNRIDSVSFTPNSVSIIQLTRASKEEMARLCNDWSDTETKKLVKPFSAFCSRSFEVSIFQDTKKAATTIYVVRDRTKRGSADEILSPVIHRVACCLSKVIPQFVEDITEEERAFCEAAQRDDMSKFRELCEAEYAKFDFRSMDIVEKMRGFTVEASRRMVRNLQDQIMDRERYYKENLESLKRYAAEIEDLNMRLTMYQSGKTDPEKDEEELIEYMKSMPGLYVLRKRDNKIQICFVGPMDEFDPVAYRDWVTECHNSGSYVFRYSPYTIEETKRLYNAIFVEHKFDLYIYATYSIDAEAYVTPQNYNPSEFQVDVSHALPNPHIQRHSCVGGYGSHFVECGRRHDFIGALTVAAQSARCVNVAESASAAYLFEGLFDGKPCLKTQDGRWINAHEAMEAIKSEEKK